MTITSICQIRSYRHEVEHHCHDFHQVILPCNGVMHFEAKGNSGRIAGAIGALVGASETHSFRAEPSARFIVLDLGTRPDVSKQLEQGPFLRLDRGLCSLIEAFRVAEPDTPRQRALWIDLFLDGLAQISAHPSAEEVVLDRALAFMRTHLDQELHVEDIARTAGTSVSGLHRLMRKRLRTTPHAHLAELRLDLAESLLIDSTLSIAEIAARVGHSDQSALTRALRRDRGVTPAVLRRMFQS